ncbi:hypothetical protein [Nocardia panacis]|uniref:hypothetical protein n=1 Tax=Nocardia panacis TaxID=2340916 RepID=UPI000E718C21|nr:hypothetical protein [Nocardia panacis]
MIAAGREWQVEISSSDQGLRITGRSGKQLDVPIEFAVTGDDLYAYYVEVGKSRLYPEDQKWQQWQSLMSTHLLEALHELDRHEAPCVITVGTTGFTATPRQLN